MPGIMGETEGSTADAAGKAVIIPLGSTLEQPEKGLSAESPCSMGQQWRWGSLSEALEPIVAWGSRGGGAPCLKPLWDYAHLSLALKGAVLIVRFLKLRS